MSEVIVPDPSALILDGLALRSPAQMNRSGWTGTRKVVGLPGAALWTAKATIDIPPTELAERPWRAFLFGLKGTVNWFRLPVACSTYTGAAPTVRAGAGPLNTLPLQGLPAMATPLVAGQYMTVPLPSGRFRLVCLTQNLTTNSQGQGTATFQPDLTEPPIAGTPVEIAKPFLPVSSTNPDVGLDYAQAVAGAALDLEEAR